MRSEYPKVRAWGQYYVVTLMGAEGEVVQVAQTSEQLDALMRLLLDVQQRRVLDALRDMGASEEQVRAAAEILSKTLADQVTELRGRIGDAGL